MYSDGYLKSGADDRVFYNLSKILFALYLILLVWLVSLKCNMRITITDTYYIFGNMSSAEKVRFAKQSFVALFNRDRWFVDVFEADQDALNVVAFIPFGIYASYFLDRFKLVKTVVLTALVSFCLECAQLISNIGCFEAMDILTNTLGGFFGYVIFKLIYKDTEERIRVLKAVSCVMLIILTALVFYALTNTVNMLDFYLDVLLRRL